MDDILRITLLYDFYGELLTLKQKLVYEMYYQNDLSLTEIGQEHGISRQAVRDLLNRTKKILQTYEIRLHLVERFMEQKKEVQMIKNIIEKCEQNHELSDLTLMEIKKIKDIADAILSNC